MIIVLVSLLFQVRDVILCKIFKMSSLVSLSSLKETGVFNNCWLQVLYDMSILYHLLN